MPWNKLSIKDKSELMKLGIKYGIKDLHQIKNYYNSYKEGGFIDNIKNIYNDNIRPLVTNTYDANSNNSFDSAYQDARSKGYKTFVYKGKHYNTDYKGKYHKRYEEDVKSGKAQAWENTYPNYTNPNLRKAKQEELDTYGITNEQTKDSNFIDRFINENMPRRGYNMSDFISNIVGEHSSSSSYNNRKELEDAVNKKYNNKFKDVELIHDDMFGYTIKDNSDIKNKEEFDSFLNDLNTASLNPISKHTLEADYLFNKPIKNNDKNFRISEYKTGTKPYYYTIHNNLENAFISENVHNRIHNKTPEQEYQEYEDIIDRYENGDKSIINDLSKIGIDVHRGGFYINDYKKLNNAPIELLNKYSTALRSIPKQDATYFEGINTLLDNVGNHLVQDVEENYYQKTPGKYNHLLDNFISKESQNNNKDVTILGDLTGNDLGVYTLGVPESKEFFSIYDKWDINPLGSGNENLPIEIGTTFEIYDRAYKNKPNIDSLYTNFKK